MQYLRTGQFLECKPLNYTLDKYKTYANKLVLF